LVIAMETTAPSLYERLGGAPAVEAVVDELYDRIAADPELAHFFDNTDLRRHVQRVGVLITMVTGGPAQYRGRDMATAHQRLAIEDHHFDLVAAHLIATLDFVGADPVAADELVTIVAGLRGDIVNVQTASV
jgi:hemoglobin